MLYLQISNPKFHIQLIGMYMLFKIQNQQVRILILAKPNAKKTACLAIDEQGMHIALHAKAHHGEANKELFSYLSKIFGIPKRHIQLIRGENNRHKQVLLPLNDTVQKFIDHPEKFISP